MHPAAVASQAADRPAVIMARTGQVTTFADLDAASNRLANLLRERSIEPGDVLAIFAENHPRFLEVAWAAQRAGLYYTAINSHLTAEEAAYIADDSGAVDRRVDGGAGARGGRRVQPRKRRPTIRVRLLLGGSLDGWERYETVVDTQPSTPIADEMEGDFLLYSSGTTGRPKGIKRPLTLAPLGQGPPAAVPFLQALGLGAGDVYLCPAPLYHAAPLAWSMGAQRLGAHRRGDGAVRPGRGARPDREVPGDPRPVRADHVRPHAQAPRVAAGRVRRVQPEGGRPRRRAVPGRGEGGDDRLVGADHQRVLLGDRGHRRHVHHDARSR